MKLKPYIFGTLLASLFLTSSTIFGFEIRLSPSTILQFCQVIKVHPDSVDISYTDSSTHEEGVTTIGYDSLPQEIQNQYFDPYQVTQYRKQLKEANIRRDAEIKAAEEMRRQAAIEAQRQANIARQSTTQNSSEAVAVNNAKLAYQRASMGFADDQYTYGVYCIEGVGVQKDPKTGASWLLLAAKNGNVKSQSAIGYCYMSGCGVLQNLKEAKKWLQIAASYGDETAKQNLIIVNKYQEENSVYTGIIRGVGYIFLMLIVGFTFTIVRRFWSRLKSQKQAEATNKS